VPSLVLYLLYRIYSGVVLVVIALQYCNTGGGVLRSPLNDGNTAPSPAATRRARRGVMARLPLPPGLAASPEPPAGRGGIGGVAVLKSLTWPE
jgi:hypothetical protein